MDTIRTATPLVDTEKDKWPWFLDERDPLSRSLKSTAIDTEVARQQRRMKHQTLLENDPESDRTWLYMPESLGEILRNYYGGLMAPATDYVPRMGAGPQMYNVTPMETPAQTDVMDQMLTMAKDIDKQFDLAKGLTLNLETRPPAKTAEMPDNRRGEYSITGRQFGLSNPWANQTRRDTVGNLTSVVHELAHAHQFQDPEYMDLTNKVAAAFLKAVKAGPPKTARQEYLQQPIEVGARLVAADILAKAFGLGRVPDELEPLPLEDYSNRYDPDRAEQERYMRLWKKQQKRKK